LIIVIAGSLMDGLDGALARESGSTTVFGAILDSSCDRLTEFSCSSELWCTTFVSKATHMPLHFVSLEWRDLCL